MEQVNYGSTPELVPLSEVGQLWSTYLHNHPEVRERVALLRKRQGLLSQNHIEDKIDSSMDVLLMAKYKRMTVLEAEVKRLKEQINRHGGEI